MHHFWTLIIYFHIIRYLRKLFDNDLKYTMWAFSAYTGKEAGEGGRGGQGGPEAENVAGQPMWPLNR